MEDGHYNITYMDGQERQALVRFMLNPTAQIVGLILDNEDVVLPNVVRHLTPMIKADGSPVRTLVQDESPAKMLRRSNDTLLVDIQPGSRWQAKLGGEIVVVDRANEGWVNYRYEHLTDEALFAVTRKAFLSAVEGPLE